VWSGDGQWITFASERDGAAGLFRQRADGSGAAERLTTAATGEEHIPETWSPDDRVLLYAVRAEVPGRVPYTLWMRASAIGKSSPLPVTSLEQTGAVFSADGRWFAYAAVQSENVGDPNRGVFVQPFPPTGALYQAPKVFIDFHPVWAAGGNELVYSGSERPDRWRSRRCRAAAVSPSVSRRGFRPRLPATGCLLRSAAGTCCPTAA